MKKKHNVTLKEIADQLSLSISTVSRALKDHKDISAETKNKVKAKAKELRYFPNLFAQGFRSNRTRIVGVIVPKISHYYTSTIIEGIISKAEEKGYRVIVTESKNSFERQTEMLHTMLQFGVDGILLSLARTTKDIEEILNVADKVPVLLFDKVSRKIPCTQVIINDKGAAYNAVEHLIRLGKKRIAIFKESEGSYNSKMRYEGYLEALKNNGLEVDENLVLSTQDISLEHGRRLCNIVLSYKVRPDAIFCITDSCAVGVIKALKNANVRIPDEIAVVGFSNSNISTIIEPKLTTINQPGSKIGKTAIKYLIKEMENENEEPFSFKTIEVETELIVRDSTFRLKN
ncbi:LacI family DNA-binding transcriptional regulator [Flavicella sediminum]|uniref:LacI family DNA-binding transcriptional regulator n=1 Tax=Flavicella sediminum TaxID=2585141 RepID=UPI00111CE8E3|nr:LacI family DNA-binding transcriptional regulator [Flavicella sediminum]